MQADHLFRHEELANKFKEQIDAIQIKHESDLDEMEARHDIDMNNMCETMHKELSMKFKAPCEVLNLRSMM